MPNPPVPLPHRCAGSDGGEGHDKVTSGPGGRSTLLFASWASRGQAKPACDRASRRRPL